jgi:hypothetical protein
MNTAQIVITVSPGNGLKASLLHNMSLCIDGAQPQSLAMHTKGLRSEAFLLPLPAPQAQLLIRFAKNRIFEAPLPNTNFLPGIRYEYQAIVHKAGLETEAINVAGQQEAEYAPAPDERAYQIGDYYPHPKDSATAIGVVYWLRPGSRGKRGKMLSLHTAEKAWSLNNTKPISALSLFSGLVNMNAVLAEDAGRARFPAFFYCAHMGPGWHLPSHHELRILQEQWDVHSPRINRALQAAGGQMLSGDACYWSSTESKDNPARKADIYSFYSKSGASTDKTTVQKVLAIKIF